MKDSFFSAIFEFKPPQDASGDTPERPFFVALEAGYGRDAHVDVNVSVTDATSAQAVEAAYCLNRAAAEVILQADNAKYLAAVVFYSGWSAMLPSQIKSWGTEERCYVELKRPNTVGHYPFRPGHLVITRNLPTRMREAFRLAERWVELFHEDLHPHLVEKSRQQVVESFFSLWMSCSGSPVDPHMRREWEALTGKTWFGERPC